VETSKGESVTEVESVASKKGKRILQGGPFQPPEKFLVEADFQEVIINKPVRAILNGPDVYPVRYYDNYNPPHIEANRQLSGRSTLDWDEGQRLKAESDKIKRDITNQLLDGLEKDVETGIETILKARDETGEGSVRFDTFTIAKGLDQIRRALNERKKK